MRKLTYRWTSPELSPTGQALLQSVVQSGQWSYGPVARQVEGQITASLGTVGTVLTNTGTSALWILLTLAKRSATKRQSIIVPAFGYSAAANVAASLGYNVYVADSLADAPIVDPASISRLMDDSVAAVVGINYFGYAADWDQIPETDAYMLIEDAAGSFGARYNDTPCGAQTKQAIFSFHTSKAAAAGGEGGGVVSTDPAIIERARTVGRNGHRAGYYFAETSGMNMLMPDVAACFLRDSILAYSETIDKRRRIVETLDQIVSSLGLPTADFNHSVQGRTQNYQTYALLADNRDLVIATLRMNGIEARPCWPHLVTQQPAFAQAVARTDGDLARAAYFADNIINIPVNPHIPTYHLDRLAAVLQRMKQAGIITTTRSMA